MRDIAALHVPGTGLPQISPLRAGLVNATCRVVRDGRDFALRVAAANPRELGLDGRWEQRVLECAAAAQLAPEIEYADAERGILVLRWIEGRQWQSADALQTANIERIAALLRRIHALAVPPPARRVSPAQWIALYASAAPPAHDALEAMATAQLRALDALPATAAVLCHSDLHVLNLVDCGEALVLLDWEYAHVTDPLWDVAGWSANNDFAAADTHRLLAAYLGRTPAPPEWARLRVLLWLYQYVCLLWSGLYVSLRGGADPDHGVTQRQDLLRQRLTDNAG